MFVNVGFDRLYNCLVFFTTHQYNNFKFQTKHGTVLWKWNTCDVFMNEIRMEDGPLQEREENVSVKIERKRNLKDN